MAGAISADPSRSLHPQHGSGRHHGTDDRHWHGAASPVSCPGCAGWVWGVPW